jgi:hypothetical protein
MKHFTKITPGAVKSQRPSMCKQCGRMVDAQSDNFLLEARWKIKRKADKLSFCSLKCLNQWTKS